MFSVEETSCMHQVTENVRFILQCKLRFFPEYKAGFPHCMLYIAGNMTASVGIAE